MLLCLCLHLLLLFAPARALKSLLRVLFDLFDLYDPARMQASSNSQLLDP